MQKEWRRIQTSTGFSRTSGTVSYRLMIQVNKIKKLK